MRKLTIKREKSFVGCLAKMKVYIEDPAVSELTISGVGCRKLGDLKNGEEKNFDIGCEEAKIFVIADKLSKDYCSEVWQLPLGEEDITLSGKNRYNPATGNAFRFNGNANEETKATRKKGVKKGVVILVAAFLIGIILGLIPTVISHLTYEPKDKVFTNDGLTITLTDEFMEVEQEGFELCYGSPQVAVLISRDRFSELQGLEEFSLEDYGELVIENFQLEGAQVAEENGLVVFDYEAESSDGTYHYFVTVHKSDDSFWLVQFATLTKRLDKYTESFVKWAGSIKFE